MGNARAIGFALAALLASGGPALAPSPSDSGPAQHRAPAPCASRAPSEIALGCASATPDWLAARLLAPAPSAAPRAEAFDGTLPFLAVDRLATSELTPVPEPCTLFGVGLGLGGLATARRRARASQRG